MYMYFAFVSCWSAFCVLCVVVMSMAFKLIFSIFFHSFRCFDRQVAEAVLLEILPHPHRRPIQRVMPLLSSLQLRAQVHGTRTLKA